ncbi:MAG: flagellar basal body-associated FliL family protein [candidate division Zixibacteria bacterium]|jgi:flagellar FliL protein|nr:flagellar basal body-associated FliL family protein [candidate division Zixibacteria bacterium]
MPPEEEKTTVEVSDDAHEAPKKKSNLMLFIIIGAVVVLGGAGGAFFMMGGDDAPSAPVSSATHEEKAEAAGEHGEKSKGSHATKMGNAIMYAIDDIVVNPSGTGGSRFLSVSFGFELASSALASEFEVREPLVRDALITILSSKSVAQLTDAREKEIMRYQVKKRLEQLLKTDQLVGVYYTDFVLQ